MDVSVQLLAQASMEQGGQRAVGAGVNAAPAAASAAPAGHVQSFNQAFPTAANRVDSSNMTGLIDRIRHDFDAFRLRLDPAASAHSVPAGASLSPAEEMKQVMNQSLQTQVDIFEMSISFNAGLTATQQSQSGVKTLVEKT